MAVVREWSVFAAEHLVHSRPCGRRRLPRNARSAESLRAVLATRAKLKQQKLEKAAEILALRAAFTEGEQVKIFPTTQFGFRKITVERPPQLSGIAGAGKAPRGRKCLQALAASKTKGAAKAKDEAAGRALQELIRKTLGGMPGRLVGKLFDMNAYG